MTSFRLYDNGGKTYDRYTCVFMNQPGNKPGLFESIGFNDDPYHPLGFGQHGEAMPGPHLGKRISLESLPVKAKQYVLENMVE